MGRRPTGNPRSAPDNHPSAGRCHDRAGLAAGTDPVEAVRLVLGEVPELPYLPELPGRGFGADLVARTGALLADFGWSGNRTAGRSPAHSGRDQAKARDHLNRDLDALTEQAQGVALLKVSVCGPMTLGAALELPNLHKVLTDHGAFRDLAESLTEGTRLLLAELGPGLPAPPSCCRWTSPACRGCSPARCRRRRDTEPSGRCPARWRLRRWPRLLEVAASGSPGGALLCRRRCPTTCSPVAARRRCRSTPA